MVPPCELLQRVSDLKHQQTYCKSHWWFFLAWQTSLYSPDVPVDSGCELYGIAPYIGANPKILLTRTQWVVAFVSLIPGSAQQFATTFSPAVTASASEVWALVMAGSVLRHQLTKLLEP